VDGFSTPLLCFNTVKYSILKTTCKYFIFKLLCVGTILLISALLALSTCMFLQMNYRRGHRKLVKVIAVKHFQSKLKPASSH